MTLIRHNNPLVCRSDVMKRLIKNINKIAHTNINIHISGETGSGKKTLARTIHEASGRRGTFKDISPDFLPDNKNIISFIQDAFSLCKEGTLFINNIDKAKPNFQSELAAFLHSSQFPESVCIISSSCRNISLLAKESRFNQDLCNILSVISVETPPLRDRKEDIKELAEIFLNKHNNRLKKIIPDDVYKLLLNYDWPGNIKELENVIIQASALSEDNNIKAEHFPERIRGSEPSPKAIVDECLYKLAKGLILSSSHLEDSDPVNDYMKIVEIPLYKAAVDCSEGNKSLAARYLHINRNKLSRKLKEYDINI